MGCRSARKVHVRRGEKRAVRGCDRVGAVPHGTAVAGGALQRDWANVLGSSDAGAQLTRSVQFLQVIIDSIHSHFPFSIFSRSNRKYLHKEMLLQAGIAQYPEYFELSLYCLYLLPTKFDRHAVSSVDHGTLAAAELLQVEPGLL